MDFICELALTIVEAILVDKYKSEKYSDKKIIITLSFIAFFLFNSLFIYLMFTLNKLYGVFSFLALVLLILSVKPNINKKINIILFIGYILIYLSLIFMNINIGYMIIFFFITFLFNILLRSLILKI